MRKELRESGLPPTPEQQRVLAREGGWGAAPRFFAAAEYAEQRAQLKELVGEKGFAQAFNATQYSHYTDFAVVTALWDTFERLGFTTGRVLEPGCGSGRFIAQAPDGARIVGIEKIAATAEIAALLYPDAEVRNESFAKTAIRRGEFDAVIGNVPYSSGRPFDPTHNPGRKLVLADYFVAKSVDALAPGGILGLLTSRGTLDKRNPALRRALAQSCDLLGAVRLETGSHREAAGTDVVIDVILLRKREEGRAPNGIAFEYAQPVDIEDSDGLLVNEYFLNHPHHVLGEMSLGQGKNGRPELKVASGGDPIRALNAVLTQITDNAVANGLVYDPQPTTGHTPATVADPFGEIRRFDGFLEIAGDEFQVMLTGTPHPYPVPTTQAAELRSLIKLRDATLSLLTAQSQTAEDTDEIEHLRQQLNSQYDAYHAQYGPIGRGSEAYVIRRDTDAGKALKVRLITEGHATLDKDGKFHRKASALPLLKEADELEVSVQRRRPPAVLKIRDDPFGGGVFALEKFDEQTGIATKADIFTIRVVGPRRPVLGVDEPEDAIAVSLDSADTGGKVTLAKVASLLGYTDLTAARVALGELVYDDPNGDAVVPAAEYLSGDVKTKLARAQEAAELDEKFRVNVTALLAVQPKDLLPGDIRVRLGGWVGPAYVQDYLCERFGDDSITVTYTTAWRVKGGKPHSEDLRFQVYGTPRIDALKLVELRLNQKDPVIKDKLLDGSSVTNQPATILAGKKAEGLDRDFARWCWSEHERAETLSAEYNERFNRITRRTYTGANLALPGLSPTFKPKPHQRAAVERILTDPAVDLAHDVGAGKTATMIIAAMEMRRLGRIRKPIFTVPKMVKNGFEREFNWLYPGAKVLVAGEGDLSPKQRHIFLGRARAEDWDAVIVSREEFASIPVSSAVIRAAIEGLTSQMTEMAAEEEATEDGEPVSKPTGSVKDFAKRIETFTDKMLAKAADLEYAGGLCFEEIFDYVFADEAQAYKNNLTISNIVEMRNEGSERAFDMLLKLDLLRAMYGSRVSTWASATPFTNSIVGEMYVLTLMLRPDLLDDAGVRDADRFGATFGGREMALERSNSGVGYQLKTRLRHILNAPELCTLLLTYTDVKTAAELDLKIPQLKGGAERVVTIDPLPSVTHYMRSHLAYREMGPARRRDPYVDQFGQQKQKRDRSGNLLYDEETGAPLWVKDTVPSVMNHGNLVSIHPRLVREEADGPTKITACGDILAEEYWAHANDVYLRPDGTEDPVRGSLHLAYCDIGVPSTSLREWGDWSVYEALRDYLVQAHKIPLHHIRFDSEAVNPRKQATQDAAARAGHIQILIGSRSRLGTGRNIQDRIVSIHHIDIPWTPSLIQQANGRGLRQGNQNEFISIIYYIAPGTFDGKRYETNLRKAALLRTFMTGAVADREIEDIGTEVEELSEKLAAASDNPLETEMIALEMEIEGLAILEQDHTGLQHNMLAAVASKRHRIANQHDELEELQELATARRSTRGDAFEMRVGSTTHTSRPEAGEALVGLMRRHHNRPAGFRGEVGSIGGLSIEVTCAGHDGAFTAASTTLTLAGQSRVALKFQTSEIQEQSARGLITRLENLLDTIESVHADLAKATRELEESLSRDEAAAHQPFARAEELARARARFEEIRSQLGGYAPKNPDSEKGSQDMTPGYVSEQDAEVAGQGLEDLVTAWRSTGLGHRLLREEPPHMPARLFDEAWDRVLTQRGQRIPAAQQAAKVHEFAGAAQRLRAACVDGRDEKDLPEADRDALSTMNTLITRAYEHGVRLENTMKSTAPPTDQPPQAAAAIAPPPAPSADAEHAGANPPNDALHTDLAGVLDAPWLEHHPKALERIRAAIDTATATDGWPDKPEVLAHLRAELKPILTDGRSASRARAETKAIVDLLLNATSPPSPSAGPAPAAQHTASDTPTATPTDGAAEAPEQQEPRNEYAASFPIRLASPEELIAHGLDNEFFIDRADPEFMLGELSTAVSKVLGTEGLSAEPWLIAACLQPVLEDYSYPEELLEEDTRAIGESLAWWKRHSLIVARDGRLAPRQAQLTREEFDVLVVRDDGLDVASALTRVRQAVDELDGDALFQQAALAQPGAAGELTKLLDTAMLPETPHATAETRFMRANIALIQVRVPDAGLELTNKLEQLHEALTAAAEAHHDAHEIQILTDLAAAAAPAVTPAHATKLPENHRKLRGHAFYPPASIKIPTIDQASRQEFEGVAHVHYFSSAWDWYVTGYNPSTGMAYGFCGQGDGNDELGEFSLVELEDIRSGSLRFPIERDLYFDPQPLHAIRRLQGRLPARALRLTAPTPAAQQAEIASATGPAPTTDATPASQALPDAGVRASPLTAQVPHFVGIEAIDPTGGGVIAWGEFVAVHWRDLASGGRKEGDIAALIRAQTNPDDAAMIARLATRQPWEVAYSRVDFGDAHLRIGFYDNELLIDNVPPHDSVLRAVLADIPGIRPGRSAKAYNVPTTFHVDEDLDPTARAAVAVELGLRLDLLGRAYLVGNKYRSFAEPFPAPPQPLDTRPMGLLTQLPPATFGLATSYSVDPSKGYANFYPPGTEVGVLYRTETGQLAEQFGTVVGCIVDELRGSEQSSMPRETTWKTVVRWADESLDLIAREHLEAAQSLRELELDRNPKLPAVYASREETLSAASQLLRSADQWRQSRTARRLYGLKPDTGRNRFQSSLAQAISTLRAEVEATQGAQSGDALTEDTALGLVHRINNLQTSAREEKGRQDDDYSLLNALRPPALDYLHRLRLTHRASDETHLRAEPDQLSHRGDANLTETEFDSNAHSPASETEQVAIQPELDRPATSAPELRIVRLALPERLRLAGADTGTTTYDEKQGRALHVLDGQPVELWQLSARNIPGHLEPEELRAHRTRAEQAVLAGILDTPQLITSAGGLETAIAFQDDGRAELIQIAHQFVIEQGGEATSEGLEQAWGERDAWVRERSTVTWFIDNGQPRSLESAIDDLARLAHAEEVRQRAAQWHASLSQRLATRERDVLEFVTALAATYPLAASELVQYTRSEFAKKAEDVPLESLAQSLAFEHEVAGQISPDDIHVVQAILPDGTTALFIRANPDHSPLRRPAPAALDHIDTAGAPQSLEAVPPGITSRSTAAVAPADAESDVQSEPYMPATNPGRELHDAWAGALVIYDELTRQLTADESTAQLEELVTFQAAWRAAESPTLWRTPPAHPMTLREVAFNAADATGRLAAAAEPHLPPEHLKALEDLRLEASRCARLTQTIYDIKASNIPDALARINKANTRAQRAGITERFSSETETYLRATTDRETHIVTYEERARLYLGRPVLRYNGWTFVATLTWDEEAGLVTRTVPGVELNFRPEARECDHCHTKRDRKDTYVVRHDDGTCKQVGSSCIADFLGIRPGGLWTLEWDEIGELQEGERDLDATGGGTAEPNRYDVWQVLGLTIAVADTEGYVPRSRAFDGPGGKAATADIVNGILTPPKRQFDTDEARVWREQMHQRAKAADRRVEEILQTVNSLPGGSDYEINLKAVAGARTVSARNVSLLASAYGVHARAQQDESNARRFANSAYLGRPDEKLEPTPATITRVHVLPANEYGVTTAITLDADGNRVEWLTSGRHADRHQRGDTVTISGTVKEHSSEFANIPTTRLVRATIDPRYAPDEVLQAPTYPPSQSVDRELDMLPDEIRSLVTGVEAGEDGTRASAAVEPYNSAHEMIVGEAEARAAIRRERALPPQAPRRPDPDAWVQAWIDSWYRVRDAQQRAGRGQAGSELDDLAHHAARLIATERSGTLASLLERADSDYPDAAADGPIAPRIEWVEERGREFWQILGIPPGHRIEQLLRAVDAEHDAQDHRWVARQGEESPIAIMRDHDVVFTVAGLPERGSFPPPVFPPEPLAGRLPTDKIQVVDTELHALPNGHSAPLFQDGQAVAFTWGLDRPWGGTAVGTAVGRIADQQLVRWEQGRHSLISPGHLVPAGEPVSVTPAPHHPDPAIIDYYAKDPAAYTRDLHTAIIGYLGALVRDPSGDRNLGDAQLEATVFTLPGLKTSQFVKSVRSAHNTEPDAQAPVLLAASVAGMGGPYGLIEPTELVDTIAVLHQAARHQRGSADYHTNRLVNLLHIRTAVLERVVADACAGAFKRLKADGLERRSPGQTSIINQIYKFAYSLESHRDATELAGHRAAAESAATAAQYSHFSHQLRRALGDELTDRFQGYLAERVSATAEEPTEASPLALWRGDVLPAESQEYGAAQHEALTSVLNGEIEERLHDAVESEQNALSELRAQLANWVDPTAEDASATLSVTLGGRSATGSDEINALLFDEALRLCARSQAEADRSFAEPSVELSANGIPLTLTATWYASSPNEPTRVTLRHVNSPLTFGYGGTRAQPVSWSEQPDLATPILEITRDVYARKELPLQHHQSMLEKYTATAAALDALRHPLETLPEPEPVPAYAEATAPQAAHSTANAPRPGVPARPAPPIGSPAARATPAPPPAASQEVPGAGKSQPEGAAPPPGVPARPAPPVGSPAVRAAKQEVQGAGKSQPEGAAARPDAVAFAVTRLSAVDVRLSALISELDALAEHLPEKTPVNVSATEGQIRISAASGALQLSTTLDASRFSKGAAMIISLATLREAAAAIAGSGTAVTLAANNGTVTEVTLHAGSTIQRVPARSHSATPERPHNTEEQGHRMARQPFIAALRDGAGQGSTVSLAAALLASGQEGSDEVAPTPEFTAEFATSIAAFLDTGDDLHLAYSSGAPLHFAAAHRSVTIGPDALGAAPQESSAEPARAEALPVPASVLSAALRSAVDNPSPALDLRTILRILEDGGSFDAAFNASEDFHALMRLADQARAHFAANPDDEASQAIAELADAAKERADALRAASGSADPIQTGPVARPVADPPQERALGQQPQTEVTQRVGPDMERPVEPADAVKERADDLRATPGPAEPARRTPASSPVIDQPHVPATKPMPNSESGPDTDAAPRAQPADSAPINNAGELPAGTAFIYALGQWREVIRANRSTVTVAEITRAYAVATVELAGGKTRRIPFAEIIATRTHEQMRRALAEGTAAEPSADPPRRDRALTESESAPPTGGWSQAGITPGDVVLTDRGFLPVTDVDRQGVAVHDLRLINVGQLNFVHYEWAALLGHRSTRESLRRHPDLAAARAMAETASTTAQPYPDAEHLRAAEHSLTFAIEPVLGVLSPDVVRDRPHVASALSDIARRARSESVEQEIDRWALLGPLLAQHALPHANTTAAGRLQRFAAAATEHARRLARTNPAELAEMLVHLDNTAPRAHAPTVAPLVEARIIAPGSVGAPSAAPSASNANAEAEVTHRQPTSTRDEPRPAAAAPEAPTTPEQTPESRATSTDTDEEPDVPSSETSAVPAATRPAPSLAQPAEASDATASRATSGSGASQTPPRIETASTSQPEEQGSLSESAEPIARIQDIAASRRESAPSAPPQNGRGLHRPQHGNAATTASGEPSAEPRSAPIEADNTAPLWHALEEPGEDTLRRQTTQAAPPTSEPQPDVEQPATAWSRVEASVRGHLDEFEAVVERFYHDHGLDREERSDRPAGPDPDANQLRTALTGLELALASAQRYGARPERDALGAISQAANEPVDDLNMLLQQEDRAHRRTRLIHLTSRALARGFAALASLAERVRDRYEGRDEATAEVFALAARHARDAARVLNPTRNQPGGPEPRADEASRRLTRAERRRHLAARRHPYRHAGQLELATLHEQAAHAAQLAAEAAAEAAHQTPVTDEDIENAARILYPDLAARRDMTLATGSFLAMTERHGHTASTQPGHDQTIDQAWSEICGQIRSQAAEGPHSEQWREREAAARHELDLITREIASRAPRAIRRAGATRPPTQETTRRSQPGPSRDVPGPQRGAEQASSARRAGY